MCVTGKAALRRYLAKLEPHEKAVIRNELRTAIGAVVRAENIILKGHKARHSLIVQDKPVSLWGLLKELKDCFENER